MTVHDWLLLAVCNVTNTMIQTITGGFTGDGLPGRSVSLLSPASAVLRPGGSGELYFSDRCAFSGNAWHRLCLSLPWHTCWGHSH